MLQLLRTQPESKFPVSMNAKTCVALLERTGILCDEAGSSSVKGCTPEVAHIPELKYASAD
eukprot:1149644-Pelagomonas_calceolata.AAC.2